MAWDSTENHLTWPHFLEFDKGRWKQYRARDSNIQTLKEDLKRNPQRSVVFNRKDLEKFPNLPSPSEDDLKWLDS